MARKNLKEIISDTTESFSALTRRVDELAVGEQSTALDPRESLSVAKDLKEMARATSATLNSAAPMVPPESKDEFRKTNLMLSELSFAGDTGVFFERFHARREEIEASLLSLAE